VVLPARHHDHVGCLHDQVHLTCTMKEELDQAMSKICHLCEQEREAKRKIEYLEALCKCQEGQITELRNENMDLDQGVKTHDELIEEMAEQLGLGDNGDDEEEDDDDGGDAGNEATAEENVAHAMRI
jgi:hypothetical protein